MSRAFVWKQRESCGAVSIGAKVQASVVVQQGHLILNADIARR
uniref:Uncharacterized protein n=1 Tax=Medicago truncatula TaxID=3880 RepID=A2Q232_MEDTR|nr:hypothetical protein MtrDRAFT_AC149207g8v2 [Medicago truncatula]